MSKGKIALGAIVGAGVGLAAGILTAPKSGKETRADIKAKANTAKDKTVKKAHELKGKVTNKADEVVNKSNDVAADVTSKANAVKGRVKTAAKGIKKDLK